MSHFSTSQKGVGLVEVLVSLLLLAVAVLGYSALQVQALKSTDESFERSQSLVMMRHMAEKIRANPSAIETYETQLKATTTPVASSCVLSVNTAVSASNLCTAAQLASFEVSTFRQEMDNYNFEIQIHPCPSTGGNDADNIMYSYCMLSAWGDTTPTVGTDVDVDCLNTTGNYHTKATCMMMEL